MRHAPYIRGRGNPPARRAGSDSLAPRLGGAGLLSHIRFHGTRGSPTSPTTQPDPVLQALLLDQAGPRYGSGSSRGREGWLHLTGSAPEIRRGSEGFMPRTVVRNTLRADSPFTAVVAAAGSSRAGPASLSRRP